MEGNYFFLPGEPWGTDGAHQEEGSRDEDEELKRHKLILSQIWNSSKKSSRQEILILIKVEIAILYLGRIGIAFHYESKANFQNFYSVNHLSAPKNVVHCLNGCQSGSLCNNINNKFQQFFSRIWTFTILLNVVKSFVIWKNMSRVRKMEFLLDVEININCVNSDFHGLYFSFSEQALHQD